MAYALEYYSIFHDLTLSVSSAIQREEEKVKRSLKEAAKKGDKDVCRMLAKELVQSRKAVARIYTTKAHLNSIQSQMKTQLGKLFKPFFVCVCLYVC